MEIPGFDPRTLSDEQLLARSHELSAKIAFASRFAGNGGLDMLLLMSEAIDAERRERSFMNNWRRNADDASQAIETDPDLRAAAQRAKDGTVGEAKPTRSNRHLGMRRPTPTATPRATDEAVQPPPPSAMPVRSLTPTDQPEPEPSGPTPSGSSPKDDTP